MVMKQQLQKKQTSWHSNTIIESWVQNFPCTKFLTLHSATQKLLRWAPLLEIFRWLGWSRQRINHGSWYYSWKYFERKQFLIMTMTMQWMNSKFCCRRFHDEVGIGLVSSDSETTTSMIYGTVRIDSFSFSIIAIIQKWGSLLFHCRLLSSSTGGNRKHRNSPGS